MAQSTPGPARLPGIGTSLEVRDEDGRPLNVIRRFDGHVELYAGERFVARLDEATAGALGAFLGGRVVLPADLAERMSGVIGGLEFDWMRIPAGAYAAGRTVGELHVRRRTGVTIVAVLRGSAPIVDITTNTELRAGDELVFTGRAQDGVAFRDYILRGV
jgi:TrkA domain protein